MSRKLAILFAVLAIASIANGDAGTGSPSSAYSVAVGTVFTNGTDTAFTNLPASCMFTPGFDNTTNYVWCNANYATDGTDPADNYATSWSSTAGASSGDLEALVLQRRAINASSPSTINSTLDTKITATFMANDGSAFCGGPGYLGVAYGYGSGDTNAELQSDVSFSYIMVNSSTWTTVKLTAADDTLRSKAKTCMYDNGIFYIVYTQDAVSNTDPDYDKSYLYIQGVNVTSGAVYYNGTTGIGKVLLTGPSDSDFTTSNYDLMATNWTGYGSSIAILTYYDSDSIDAGTACAGDATCSSESTGGTYKAMPITLATGTPGSVVTLGVAGSSSTVILGTEGTPTTSTTTYSTAYSVAGGFGSLSTYGVLVSKQITTYTIKESAGATVADSEDTSYEYSSSIFLNGSSTASTTFNLTNPSSYHLTSAIGYSTADGFGIISTYTPDDSDSTSNQVNLDTYYANGTAILSAVSLGTFSNGNGDASATSVQIWIDAVGSPWLGYYTQDTDADFPNLDLLNGYAGEIAYNPLSANALTSIFATLTLVIAALFAF